MKRVFGLFLILLFGLSFVLAQANPLEGVPGGDAISGLGDGENPVDKIEDIKDKLTEKRDGQDYGYLRQKWGEILERIPFIKGLHTFLTEISFLFKIFLGEPYEATFAFLLVIVLWVWIATTLGNVFQVQFRFSGLISLIIGVLFAVIFAQIGVIRSVIDFFVRLASAPELEWVRMVIWIALIGGIILLFYLRGMLTAYLAKELIEKKEEETKENQNKLEKFTGGAGI